MRESPPDFQALHREFRPRITRYVARLVGEADAEDVTQEAFAKASRALPAFRGDSQPSTWLYRIATNAAMDLLRKRAARREARGAPANRAEQTAVADVWTDEAPPSIKQQLSHREMRDCIRDFVLGLPENYRTVLVLSEWEGLPDAEIADVLGVNPGTVKIRLHRARKRLRETLEANCEFHRDECNQLACEPKDALREPPRT